MVVFSDLNPGYQSQSNLILSVSYFLALIYPSTMVLLVLFAIYLTNKPTKVLETQEHKKKWGFLYKDFRLTHKNSRLFGAFSIARYLLSAMILVFLSPIPMIQTSSMLLVAASYLVSLVIEQPYKDKSKFYSELFTEILFTVGNCFFFVLALDEGYEFLSIWQRALIGWLITMVVMVALSIRIGHVLMSGIEGMIKIFEKTKKGEDKEGDEEVRLPLVSVDFDE